MRFLAVATLGVLALSCTRGGTNPVAGPDGGTMMIGSSGGEVSSSDGRVIVSVPPGALDNPIVLTISQASVSGAPLIGSAVEIGPTGQTFKRPIRITLAYDPAGLNGEPLSSLRLGNYVNGTWVPVGFPELAPGSHVRGETSHLSIYGVMVSFSCHSDSDCHAPESCVHGKCGIPCRTPDECPGVLSCYEGQCQFLGCAISDPSFQCPSPKTCQLDFLSESGTCGGAACASDSNNASDPVCSPAGPGQRETCGENGPGLGGRCWLIQCDGARPCPADHSCVWGNCVWSGAGCRCSDPGCPCTPGSRADGGPGSDATIIPGADGSSSSLDGASSDASGVDATNSDARPFCTDNIQCPLGETCDLNAQACVPNADAGPADAGGCASDPCNGAGDRCCPNMAGTAFACCPGGTCPGGFLCP